MGEDLLDAERAAIRDAPGGVLWEALRAERLSVKKDPARRGALANEVKAALDRVRFRLSELHQDACGGIGVGITIGIK